ncbi:MAG: hypothetical protein ACI9R3_002809 [Verrucomicrobiales bacterium]|jgi:hypothetical protein
MRKLFAFVLTAVVLQATPALALVGGPWDNNSHEGNSDGVYSATMILKGGVGLVSWSQINSIGPEISRYAESVVWYKGAVYFGTTFARVDVQARKVTGITNGEVGVSGITGASPAAGAVHFCTTQWRGKVRDLSNSVYFTAKGSASFFGDYSDEYLPSTVIEVQDNIQVVDANGIPIQTTVTTTTTTIPGAGGPNAAFPAYRNRTSVLVFGSRTSSIGIGYPSATGLSRTGFGGDAAAAGGGGGGGGN